VAEGSLQACFAKRGAQWPAVVVRGGPTRPGLLGNPSPHVGNKADVGTEIGFNVSGLATFP